MNYFIGNLYLLMYGTYGEDVPPGSDDFLLLDESNFLLLDGTDFDLLGK